MSLDDVDFADLKRSEKKQNPELCWESEDTFMVKVKFKGGPKHGVIIAKGLARKEREQNNVRDKSKAHQDIQARILHFSKYDKRGV